MALATTRTREKGQGTRASLPAQYAARIKLFENVAIAFLFVALISLPFLFQAAGIDPGPKLAENRRLAPPPEIGRDPYWMLKFPKQFEPYYNDHFAMRNPLIRMDRVITAGVLRTSPMRNVIIGKGDWLFDADEDSMRNYTGSPAFTKAELAEWSRVIRERHEWLKARKIHYVLVVIPEKQSIYPEYMPDWVPRSAPGHTRLDELINELRARTHVEILDMRPALLAEKRNRQLYLYRDTHWNYEGAYIGYNQIVRLLGHKFPGVAPIPRADLRETTMTLADGDLANLMGVSGLYTEPWVKLEPCAGYRAQRVEAGKYNPPYITIDRYKAYATEIADYSLPTAVVYRDSFSTILMPMLSEHFRRAVYIWNANYKPIWGCDFDPEIIEREHPDVFIEEFVERRIGEIPTNWTARK